MKIVSYRLSAPAKLNLTLHVAGRRDDGFHSLVSLVCGIDLCDTLTVRAGGDRIITIDDNGSGIAPEANLALRAALLLQDRTGVARGARVSLIKRIPIGAGLGGGSSDAAAALRLCDRLWAARLPTDRLQSLGAELGSDVPLFFHLPAAVIRGRGEQVDPVHPAWRGSFVLVHGGWPVSTSATYAAFASGIQEAGRADHSADAVQARNASELATCLANDLAPAVFRVEPRVAALGDRLGSLGIGRWGLTGAGSTFFLPSDERGEAEELARRVRDANLGVVVEVADALTAAPTLIEATESASFDAPPQRGTSG